MRVIARLVLRASCAATSLLLLTAALAAAQCPPGSTLIGPGTVMTSGPNPNGLAIADFDHDGILDIAVTNSDRLAHGAAGAGTLGLFHGRGSGGVGDGTFDPVTTLPCGLSPLGIAAAHLNGDTWIDLVVAGWGENKLLVFLGQPGGSFASPVRYATGARPHHLVLADFNGDGILDAATANNGESSVSVLAGQGADHVGDGSFGPPTNYLLRTLSTGIATADFDGDGILDLAAAQTYNGDVAILRGNGLGGVGNGTFRPAKYVAAGPQPYLLAAADVNADNHNDLVVGNGNSAGVVVLLGRPDTTLFGNPLASGPLDNVGDVRVADIDKDGVPDVAVTYSTGNRLSVLRGHNVNGVGDGTFTEVDHGATGDFPTTVEPVDFDMDGHLDFVASHYFSNSITVFRGKCDVPPPPPPTFHIARVLDVPNDEGGRVFVTWYKHAQDATGGPVNAYRVWRRIVAPAVAKANAVLRAVPHAEPDGTTSLWWWEALATLPAQRLATYGYTAATTQDSLPNGNPYTAFFVTALTANIDVFYDTPVDSGYSVDNRPPAPPSALTAQHAGLAVQLSWEPSPAADLARYELHRGAAADFTPGDANRVASTTEPAWSDPTGAEGWYKLVAVDAHENRSACVATYVASVLDGGAPAVAFALHAVTPNPSRGAAMAVRFSLPTATPARLDVFDAAGRRVWSRAFANATGEHSASLADARLPAGLYLVRLRQGVREASTRVTVLP